jgi:hypothetical protein
MRRTLLAGAAVGTVTLAALTIWLIQPSSAQPKPSGTSPVATQTNGKPPSCPLPIAQVILFSSGVGYFQREGELEGNARVDLTFPGTDVNDLLKSLVLQDTNGGKVGTINYDSPDPIEKTLKSFALDLTYNPSLGQLLNQARGEKIEVTLQQSPSAQPGPLSGVILGMESQRQPHGKDQVIEVELLNLLCSEGIRSIPLTQVQRLRFVNATLDSELHRALEVLASRHDSQKKVVSLSFNGAGKRPVRVGYVIENPIWKTSYRLMLEEKGKAFLQGWAVVENTSDDDWKDVRMALVSGRPISFRMDLYQPLFIPRPTVEPELFASLRPPTFSGALTGQAPQAAQAVQQGGGMPGMMGGYGMGGMGMGIPGGQGLMMGNNPILANGMAPFNRYNFQNSGVLNWNGLNLGNLQQIGMPVIPNSNNDNNFTNPQFSQQRLTYEELVQRNKKQQDAAREKARSIGSTLAAINLKEGVHSVASAEEIGDHFQYTIDHKVTLPRQKSALLPIVNHDVQAHPVSIFNESVQARFPLLGLKFKNTSGQNLMQGPITIYEGTTYAGDTRVLDLQPNEERLIAYAIDQATEVKAESQSAPQQLVSAKLVKGVLLTTHKLRETKTYLIKNRSTQDRLLIVEHPVRTDWNLVAPEKPTERSRDVYRFEIKVPAGKSQTLPVIDEQARQERLVLNSIDDKSVRLFLTSPVSSAKVKEALEKAVSMRTKLSDTQRELTQVQAQLKGITEDQGRLRANLERLPPTSAAYKRYLEKFDTQETEIEKLQAQIRKLQESEKGLSKDYEEYLAGLSVD